MNSKKLITLCVFTLLFVGVYGQKTQKELEREKNKVEMYTSKEKDNLQRWFYEEVNKMGLSETERESYYSILLSHTYDMGRLDDHDKDFTDEERPGELHKIVKKMNAKIKELLTTEQYILHLESFDKILYSVNRKRN